MKVRRIEMQVAGFTIAVGYNEKPVGYYMTGQRPEELNGIKRPAVGRTLAAVGAPYTTSYKHLSIHDFADTTPRYF